MRAPTMCALLLAPALCGCNKPAPPPLPPPPVEPEPLKVEEPEQPAQIAPSAAPKTRFVSHMVNGQLVIEEVPVESVPIESVPVEAAAPVVSAIEANAPPAAGCAEARSEVAALAKQFQRTPPPQNALARSREMMRACKSDPGVRLARAVLLVSASTSSGDPAARQEMLTEAAELEPNGDVYMRLGKAADDNNQLAAAIDAYRRAVELGARGAKRELEEAERRFKVEGRFDRRANQYFVARFEGEEQKALADTVLEVLEEARKDIGDKLGLYPNKPINVVIYTGTQYQEALNAPDWSGGRFDGQIRVREGDVRAARGTLRDLLVHEYVHAALRTSVSGDLPAWLHEGLAQRFEPGEDHAAILRRLSGKKASELPSLMQLRLSFSRQADAKVARLYYASALDIVDELARWRTERSFKDLFEAMNKGRKFEDALYDVYSLDLNLLEQRWKDRYR